MLGWVKFTDMPVGTSYSIMVYMDSENYDYPVYDNYVAVYLGTERDYTIPVNL